MLKEAGFQPGMITPFRPILEFSSWIKRMNTPVIHVQAIRSLQERADAEVRSHFAMEADGSFTLDTMLLNAGG